MKIEDVREKMMHIDSASIRGRCVPLLPYFDADKKEWNTWIFDGNKLHHIKGMPIEGIYFASEAENENDGYLKAVDFVFQRTDVKKFGSRVEGFISDVMNLATSLAKIEFIHQNKHMAGGGQSRMIETEVEYIYTVIRSMYDIIQEILSIMWESVTLKDKNIPKNKLPNSYSDIVMSGGKLRSRSDISKKWGLPESISSIYENTAHHFILVRDVRDKIIHSWGSVRLIFSLDNGFAVKCDEIPFSKLPIWCNSNVEINNLGSLKSVLLYLIHEAIGCFEEMFIAYESIIEFYPPISPTNHVFLRSRHLRNLLNMQPSIKDTPWYESLNSEK